MITKHRDQTQIVWHKATHVITQKLSQKSPVTNWSQHNYWSRHIKYCGRFSRHKQLITDIESVNQIKTIFVSPRCICTHHPGDTAEKKLVFVNVISDHVSWVWNKTRVFVIKLSTLTSFVNVWSQSTRFVSNTHFALITWLHPLTLVLFLIVCWCSIELLKNYKRRHVHVRYS